MKRHLFLLSSAVATAHSKFSLDERVNQTLVTIDSIRNKVPGAKIAIFESSAIKLEDPVKQKLREVSDFIAYTGEDPIIQTIYNGTENWDMIKSFSEIISFIRGMHLVKALTDISTIDRIHKISGRYVLNEYFDLSVYEKFADKIIVAKKIETQFVGDREKFVQIPFYHPCMLWSWPTSHYNLVHEFYSKSAQELNVRQSQNRYADIEHLMYMLLPKTEIKEVDAIGIQGLLGITGTLIRR